MCQGWFLPLPLFLAPGSPLPSSSPFPICDNPSRPIRPQLPQGLPESLRPLQAQVCHLCPACPLLPSPGSRHGLQGLTGLFGCCPWWGPGLLGQRALPHPTSLPSQRAWHLLLSLTRVLLLWKLGARHFSHPFLFLILLPFCLSLCLLFLFFNISSFFHLNSPNLLLPFSPPPFLLCLLVFSKVWSIILSCCSVLRLTACPGCRLSGPTWSSGLLLWTSHSRCSIRPVMGWKKRQPWAKKYHIWKSSFKNKPKPRSCIFQSADGETEA